MHATTRRLAALLALLAAIELAAELTGGAGLAFVTKATLLPLLGAAYLSAVPSPRTRTDRRMVVAFAGSWVGDVALMLAPAHPGDDAVLGLPKHDAWFVVGVVAFLVCHLALIAVYRDVTHPEVAGPLPRHWPRFVPLVLYGAAIGAVVLPPMTADPKLGVAIGPVAVYAGVLCTMVAMAGQRHGRVGTASFRRVLAGAAIFLLSDSLIGLTFLARVPVPQPGFLIMVTYLAAEVLIAWGVATQRLDEARRSLPAASP